MENPKVTQQPGKTTGTESTAGQAGQQPAAGYQPTTPQAGQTSATSARQSRDRYADSVADKVSEDINRAGETLDQAKQAVTDAWDRTSRSVNETYEQALDYGRENPAKITLIAFGVGVAVGVLIAGNVVPRSRTRRMVPPVMNALSDIATEFFR